MPAPSGITTFLFTDIEGSSGLWEREPARMHEALACHDAIARAAVVRHGGRVVKTTGDGVHAVFDDPLDAVVAALEFLQALADPAATGGIVLKVRCGLHAGVEESRDDDFFGRAVNRAARIMSVANGGQVLVSQTVASLVAERLPDEVSLRDLGAVRLRDLAQPERVHQVVHPKLRADFPALRTLASTPNNLPQQLSSFVGRERELAEVRRLLGGNRLLTLLGVGGIGKTRLSLQAAADAMDDFTDGVWLVELASLADPRLVPQALASALGVKEEGGRPVVEALEKFVGDRRLLVVLDNCEHLVQACAELATALLRAGAAVKILASSREPLHVTGEAIFPVPPLAVPDAESVSLEALGRYAATRLFAERAAAVQPGFALSEANAPAVAAICRRLDGIPLALELAAARVRALSVEQIAERLSDRFRLLTGGDRSALPRQQTLRALIDWSYDLLTDAERALFRRLAVFAGGFTLEAAEAVGAASDADRPGVLTTLSNLVEKSLVVLDAAVGRYRMLETVRQYAQERLAESGEAAPTRTRHAVHYVEFFEAVLARLHSPEQGALLVRLDDERENALAAHAWCDWADDVRLGLRLAHVMRVYLLTRGAMKLALQIAREALARPGAERRDAARSRACFDAGWLYGRMGRYAEAQAVLEEGLSIAREIGDRSLEAKIYQPLGAAMLGQGDRAAARRYLEGALALAREQGDHREIAAGLNALGQFHLTEGDLGLAEPLFEQVLALVREVDDRESIGIAMLNISMVAIARGATGPIRAQLLDALAIGEETGSRVVAQSVIEVSAGLAAALGDAEGCARFFGAAEAQHALNETSREPSDEAFLAPLVAKARAALGSDAFSAAEREGAALGRDQAAAAVRAFLEARR
jgi:predicted ATPase/class 3 adenylate cyclase